MRNRKSRVELFSTYDHTGIAAHLERQAGEGWMLEKIGTWTWKYRRIEPQALRFAVTYYPRASFYDPGPSEGERTFRDFCGEAGWKLAASSAQMQVFYNESSDPLPLETDAALQVENIHSAAKRSYLLSQFVLLAVALLQIGIQLLNPLLSLVNVLTNSTNLFNIVIWLLLLVLCLAEITGYYSWYKRAQKAAEQTGSFLPTKSRRWVQIAALGAALVLFWMWIVSLQSSRMMLVACFSFGYVLLMMALVNGCRLLLKRLKVSKTKNLVITLLVDAVLAVCLALFLTHGVMQVELPERAPVDTYEHHGLTREVFDDPLPLQVEDLLEVDSAGYSKEITDVQETVFAGKFEAQQFSRGDFADQPELSYTIITWKLPFLEEPLWKSLMERYGGTEPESGYWVREDDPAPWGAVRAYRRYQDSEATSSWLLRYDQALIRLYADWELTEEQMAIIAEKLTAMEREISSFCL